MRFSLVRIAFLAIHGPMRSSNSGAAQALATNQELRCASAANEVSSRDKAMIVNIKDIEIQGYMAICLHGYFHKPCIEVFGYASTASVWGNLVRSGLCKEKQ